jgi:hypothetical protein
MRSRGFLSRVLPILGVAAFTVLTAGMAFAESSSADAAAAQALFDSAKQLMAAGKYADACPKLEESQRLEPGTGTLLNLANCYEQVGKLTTAWTTFLSAASAAKTSGQPDRESVARQRAAVLATKLSKIVIDVAAGEKIAGIEVRRDGMAVGRPQWGLPIPADQGPHRIEVSAPGRKPWVHEIILKGSDTLTVTVPDLQAETAPAAPTPAVPPQAAPPPVAPPPAAPAPTPPDSASKPRDESTGLGAQRAVAIAAAGVGVAGIAVGAVFGLQAKSKRDEAAPYCDGSTCFDSTGVNLKNDARSAGTISTIGFVAGGVGLVGAAVLWFTAPSRSAKTATAQLGIGPASVVLRGSW